MPGPQPKSAAIRQRRNRPSSARVLTPPDPSKVQIPPLPEKEDDEGNASEWHPLTRAWWIDTWTSPMATAFEPADIHGLFILAVLIDAFWERPTPDKAAEIRLQRQPYGLTPIDRNRLQWTIDRPEEEAKPKKSGAKVKDPRKALRSA